MSKKGPPKGVRAWSLLHRRDEELASLLEFYLGRDSKSPATVLTGHQNEK